MSSSSIVKSVHGRQYREYRGSAANLYTTLCCLPRDYWGHLPSPTFPLYGGWWPPSTNLVWSLHPAGRSHFRSKSGVERDVLRSSDLSYIVLTLPPSSGRNSERLQGGLALRDPVWFKCLYITSLGPKFSKLVGYIGSEWVKQNGPLDPLIWCTVGWTRKNGTPTIKLWDTKEVWWSGTGGEISEDFKNLMHLMSATKSKEATKWRRI